MPTLNMFHSIPIAFSILCLFGVSHPSSALAGETTESYQARFEIPIFKGAYHIQTDADPVSGFDAIRYRVRLKPPAAEIIEFYDSYFNANGWISSFEICQRHWDNSHDQSAGSEPLMQQMYASWEHPDLDLKFVLWLKYDLAATHGAEEIAVDGRLQSKTGT